LSDADSDCYAAGAQFEMQEMPVDVLTRLGPMDLFIVVTLAGGVFAGFMAGMVRYALNGLVVLVAFVVASQLKGPLFNLLGFWEAFTPGLREQIIFLVLFVGLVVGGWFAVRVLYHRTRLPIARQLDELGGAVLGLLFAVLSIVFTLLVMDSFFKLAPDTEVGGAGILRGFYDAMEGSVLVDFFRSTIIPTFGQVTRPFVPSEIAELIEYVP
jgi:uncharacterized membrane protein required for colicin V production